MKPQQAELEGPLESCWSNPLIREVSKPTAEMTAETGGDLSKGKVSLSLSSTPISRVHLGSMPFEHELK